MTNKRIVSILLAAVFSAALLTGCGSTQESAGKPEPTPESAPESGMFPITYEVSDKSNTFTGYKIEKDESDNVTVKIFAHAYTNILGSNDKYRVPLTGVFENNGEITEVICDNAELLDEITSSTTFYGTGSHFNVAFAFPLNTSVSPEKITLKRGDTGEIFFSFNVEDVPQVNG